MGKWKGGGQPFGYSFDKKTSTLIINPDEKIVILKIFELAKRDYGVTNIADELNTIGFMPRRGKRWSATTVSYMLSPARLKFYQGLTNHDKPGDWEALLSELDYFRLLKIRAESLSKFVAPKRKERTKYLLSAIGIFKCGYCHGPVKSSVTIKNSEKTLYYYCTSRQSSGENTCKNSRLHKQDLIDHFVITELHDRISDSSRINKYIKLFQDKLLDEARVTYKNLGEYFAEHLDLEIEQAQNYLLAQLKLLGELNDSKSKLVLPYSNEKALTQEIILHNIESIRLFNDYIEVQYKFPINHSLEFVQTLKFTKNFRGYE
ncbi:MAG: recombinase zinc beta ribbon domain-containing protein [Ignavibacteriales bacterium]|nr:recombinase zinc beta ribbon domain-containing protein [Ignavibacteriales bacterium]